MIPRPLLLLSLLSLLYTSSAHLLIRQDDGSGASPSPSPDTPDESAEASPSPTDGDAGASSAPAAATTSAASGSGESSLGGAGTGGSYPAACSDCADEWNLIYLCSTEQSSESCSPLCTSYTRIPTCLNCLLTNGQPGVDQTGLQQVVWNLEAACSDLELPVGSVTLTGAASTTGPFTTPSTTPTPTPTGSGSSAAASSTTHHSGLTDYNTTTRTINTAVSTSVAVPSQTGAAGSAPRRAGGSGVVGGVVFGAIGVGAMIL